MNEDLMKIEKEGYRRTMARRSILQKKRFLKNRKNLGFKAKDRYEAELDKLEKLMRKRDELRSKELMERLPTATFEEVMRFLSGNEVMMNNQYLMKVVILPVEGGMFTEISKFAVIAH